MLLTYAAASFVYRLLIFGVILLGVHALGRAYRLQVLAWMITLLALSSLVIPLVISAAQPLMRRGDRRRVSPSHALGTLLVLGGTLAGLLLVPVPYHVYAPFVIEADAAERVTVTVPGRLKEVLPAGTRVRPGDVIGRLESPQLTLQYAELSARRDLLERQLAGYTAVRGDSEETAVRIPATREAIADLQQRLATLEEKRRRLELQASRSGEILPPPNVPQEATEREELPVWHGSPLDPINRGCYLESGTPLCLVGDATEVTATVIVPQADLPFVRTRQKVELLLAGLSDRTLPGVVADVSPVPVDALPREVAARGLIPVDADAHDPLRPAGPVYRVRVRLDMGDSVSPLLWSTGEARIRLASEPLAYRVWRGVQRTFHFEL